MNQIVTVNPIPHRVPLRFSPRRSSDFLKCKQLFGVSTRRPSDRFECIRQRRHELNMMKRDASLIPLDIQDKILSFTLGEDHQQPRIIVDLNENVIRPSTERLSVSRMKELRELKQKMLEIKPREIAIYVQENSVGVCKYKSIACITIATGHLIAIINPVRIYKATMEYLKELCEDPSILKIISSLELTSYLLQLDMNTFLCGAVDVQYVQAIMDKILNGCPIVPPYERKDLQEIAKSLELPYEFTGVEHFYAADFRKVHESIDLLSYQADIAEMLYIIFQYQKLSLKKCNAFDKLLEFIDSSSSEMKLKLARSFMVLRSIPESFEQWKTAHNIELNNDEAIMCMQLLSWRHEKSLYHDISAKKVLTDNEICFLLKDRSPLKDLATCSAFISKDFILGSIEGFYEKFHPFYKKSVHGLYEEDVSDDDEISSFSISCDNNTGSNRDLRTKLAAKKIEDLASSVRDESTTDMKSVLKQLSELSKLLADSTKQSSAPFKNETQKEATPVMTIGVNQNYGVVRLNGSRAKRFRLQYPDLIVVPHLRERLNNPIIVDRSKPCLRCRRDDHRTRNCPFESLGPDWTSNKFLGQGRGFVVHSRGHFHEEPEHYGGPGPSRRYQRPQRGYCNPGYFTQHYGGQE